MTWTYKNELNVLLELIFIDLEHLHVLSQEALDHADLPVLTATLGASALIKNSLYCYIQGSQHTGNGERTGSLQVSILFY